MFYTVAQPMALGGASAQGPKAIRVLEEAVSVMEALAQSSAPMGVSELSRTLRLPKSTVFRLLHNLERLGYVRRVWGARYALGLKVLEIAASMVAGLELRQLAHPYLQNLGRHAGGTVHLGIRDGNDVVYVDKVDGWRLVRAYSYVGMRAPLHAVAMGKVILAYLTDDDIRSYLVRDLRAFTPHTPIEPERLYHELMEARQNGYAVNRGGLREDVSGVAVPVLGRSGQPLAAIGVSIPSVYFEDEFNTILPHLRQAGEKLSRVAAISPGEYRLPERFDG